MIRAERAAVEWARANAAISALVPQRVSTRLPASPTFPYLVVYRAAGAAAHEEIPSDLPLLTWECWARGATVASGAADWTGAETLEATLMEQAQLAQNYPTAFGHIGYFVVLDARRSPVPDSDEARFLVDTLMFIMPA